MAGDTKDVYPDQFIAEAQAMTREQLQYATEEAERIAHAWVTKEDRGEATAEMRYALAVMPRDLLEAAYVAARMVDVSHRLAASLTFPAT